MRGPDRCEHPKVSGSRKSLEQLSQNIPRNQDQLKMFWKWMIMDVILQKTWSLFENEIDDAVVHACHGLLSTTNHNASLSRLKVCRYNVNPVGQFYLKLKAGKKVSYAWSAANAMPILSWVTASKAWKACQLKPSTTCSQGPVDSK